MAGIRDGVVRVGLGFGLHKPSPEPYGHWTFFLGNYAISSDQQPQVDRECVRGSEILPKVL